MRFKRTIKTDFKGYHSLTEDVNQLLQEVELENGYCVVSLDDDTTGLCITSFWDPRGLDDLIDSLDWNFPSKVHFKNQISPFDAAGRIKSVTMGSSALIMIQDRKLLLGSSQGLVLLEFDGPRERNYHADFVAGPVTHHKRTVNTEYMGMHDLTPEIVALIAQQGVKNGICHIAMPHSTAGLLLCHGNDLAKKNIMEDIERMVPTRADFKHRETASDAGGHVKTAITGSQLTLTIAQGKLLLSPQQAVVFAEFDGPRPRKYFVSILAG